MIFTEKEQKEIDRQIQGNTLLIRLWDEYQKLCSDGSKKLFTAFNDALGSIAESIEDRTLDSENKWFKAVMEIGKNGEKLFNSSTKGRIDENSDEKEVKGRMKKHDGKVIV